MWFQPTGAMREIRLSSISRCCRNAAIERSRYTVFQSVIAATTNFSPLAR